MPPPSWFWVYPWSNGDSVTPPQARPRSRSPYVNDPCGTLVPLRVVDATSPPENWPRATSYVLVTTRVVRRASCGTFPEPNERPSSVMVLAVERWPATENAVLVESVSPIPTTPGARVASVFRSEASIGRRATNSGVRLRSVEPGVGRSTPRRRSEEHTSELQSQSNLVCRLLLEKKKQ